MWGYVYDTAGNITEKKVHNRTALGVGVLEQTIPYVYATSGWKDRLVSYGNETISYDALGNPTTYRGHSLTWGKVKQLQSYDSNTFTYNAEGIRTSKNDITYELDGTKILREVRGVNVIEYFYGTNGIAGFSYNGEQYYYQKSIYDDIVAIYNEFGTKVAEYVYDAWGKCTVALDTNGIGTINPLRYRGYYYDVETGLYYLQTRYYDPEICRFINADDISNLGKDSDLSTYNIFAYCGCDPVNRSDSLGSSWWSNFTKKAKETLDGIVDTVVSVVDTVKEVVNTVADKIENVISIGTDVAVTISALNVASKTGDPLAGIAVFGYINNATNMAYYAISDGKSNLTSNSYTTRGYLSRWERLDYVKQQLSNAGYDSDYYSPIAWRYYSEYSLHMYGWFLTGWAYEKGIPLFSYLAERCKSAEVYVNEWDERWFINVGTVIWGIFGM